MNTDSVMNSPGKDFLNDTEPSGTSRQKDVCIAVLLSNPHNFAALFNYLDLFEDKIRPEELVEMDFQDIHIAIFNTRRDGEERADTVPGYSEAVVWKGNGDAWH